MLSKCLCAVRALPIPFSQLHSPLVLTVAQFQGAEFGGLQEEGTNGYCYEELTQQTHIGSKPLKSVVVVVGK